MKWRLLIILLLSSFALLAMWWTTLFVVGERYSGTLTDVLFPWAKILDRAWSVSNSVFVWLAAGQLGF